MVLESTLSEPVMRGTVPLGALPPEMDRGAGVYTDAWSPEDEESSEPVRRRRGRSEPESELELDELAPELFELALDELPELAPCEEDEEESESLRRRRGRSGSESGESPPPEPDVPLPALMAAALSSAVPFLFMVTVLEK